jgi:thymidine phosphorylase
MDAPLGRAIGNALEVVECVDTLQGRGPRDVEDLSLCLAAQMLVVGGVAADVGDAQHRVRRALSSGAGFEKFREMVTFQGGDARALEDRDCMPVGPLRDMVPAARTGVVVAADAGAIGRATVLLGAGRDTVGGSVDHGVGAVVMRKPGDRVAAGDPLVELYYRREDRLSAARRLVKEAFVIGDEAPAATPLVLEVIR